MDAQYVYLALLYYMKYPEVSIITQLKTSSCDSVYNVINKQ